MGKRISQSRDPDLDQDPWTGTIGAGQTLEKGTMDEEMSMRDTIAGTGLIQEKDMTDERDLTRERGTMTVDDTHLAQMDTTITTDVADTNGRHLESDTATAVEMVHTPATDLMIAAIAATSVPPHHDELHTKNILRHANIHDPLHLLPNDLVKKQDHLPRSRSTLQADHLHRRLPRNQTMTILWVGNYNPSNHQLYPTSKVISPLMRKLLKKTRKELGKRNGELDKGWVFRRALKSSWRGRWATRRR